MSLVLRNVGKVVGAETHLSGVSLSLDRGSLNVLLGPTLSGKTSLIRVMAGLDQPSSGTIEVDGRDVTGVPVRRRNVAIVYQQFINYPTLSVYENIASPLRVARLPKAEIDARVRDAARLKLTPMLDRLPERLSGGQRQRTAIARALVKRANLVLMDEPLANLDYKLREELREELPKVFSQTGAILVYATTEPSEALLLGGKTATLSEGRVTQFGQTADLYRRPHDLATAQVFSDPPLNTVSARQDGGRLLLGAGTAANGQSPLAGLPDGDYTVAFRAHHLTLSRPAEDAITFAGRVTISEVTGSETFIHLDASGTNLVALLPGVHRLDPGSEVTVHVEPGRLFAFGADGRLSSLPDTRQAAA